MTPPLTHEGGEKPRMLIVDDEALGCRLVKALFSRTFEVHTALSVAEARKNFDLDTFDVAIVDYHMPGENGVVLIEILRGKLPRERIFLTTADDSMQGLEAGRYTYVAKPFDPESFIAEVTQAVRVALAGSRQ